MVKAVLRDFSSRWQCSREFEIMASGAVPYVKEGEKPS